jgi:hypothetical protein
MLARASVFPTATTRTPTRHREGLGLVGGIGCVHLTTPATAGASGLASLDLLRPLLTSPARALPGSFDRIGCVHLTTPATAGAPGPSAQPSCLPLHRMLDTAPQESRRRSLSEPSLPNVLGFSCKGPSPSTPIDQKKGGQPQAASIRRSQSTQPFGGHCQLQT